MPSPSYILLALLALPPAWGQNHAYAPVLHRRIADQPETGLDDRTRSSGRTILPLEASGEYELGGGAIIEIELQPDRLDGYLTRPGDRESDQGTPLTFFFATSRLAGPQINFTTRQVHGVWWSFQGTIVRGSAAGRDKQGYYQLEGQLIMHDAFSQTQQARMVSLPLARQNPNG